ncbi:MAG TPA: HDOD domain-containing protein [Rhodanobacteraceae bacterium]|jgi:HD-like signal output (HDOD) protein|nr:HDOD domain-containing protein [Rhodanobacteraceae bacterium]
MTTTLLLIAVSLLGVAGGTAGWWLHARRRGRAFEAAPAGRAAGIAEPAGPAASTPQAGPAQAPSSADDIVARMYALAFEDGGDDDAQVDPSSPLHGKIARAAAGLLSRIKPGSSYAPRRPHLLPQLLRIVNDEDSSVREIAAIISRDPAMAGNLLRISNSVLYRVSPEPVEDIQRAVAMIGTDGLRQMIAVALMQPVLSGGSGPFARLPAIIWEHTLLAAVATAEHARHVERKDAFTAQMLGLLHGLGSIVVVQVARDSYRQHPELAPDPAVVLRLLEQWAARTARRLSRDWALSASIAPALDDQRRDAPLRELTPLGRSLRIGQVAGAAAMLHRLGRIQVEAAFVLMQQRLGLHEDLAARIWERLSRT